MLGLPFVGYVLIHENNCNSFSGFNQISRLSRMAKSSTADLTLSLLVASRLVDTSVQLVNSWLGMQRSTSSLVSFGTLFSNNEFLANQVIAILSVPATYKGDDINEPSDSPYPSVSENENAPCLNWKRLKFFRSLYDAKTDAERAEITARPICFRSPLDGNLNGVCRTYVATAGCDPLRDEGEDYARKLNENGVQVTVRRYTGVPHPFMHMLVVKKAQMYMDDICAHLRMAHGALFQA